uniref:Putative p1/s1 nuclease n=1 Tax=Leishmania guyanensis TaxID=5670 RepID=A0A1E1J1S3_LEIGU|nr:Putative p1/s1 nuclease [Leishmania guyanensis]
MPASVSLRLCLRVRYLLVLISALCAVGVLGWGCTGHMVLAEIARRQLDPSNEKKIQAMAMKFKESGPFLSSPDMIQAACWPDDVKRWGQDAMSTWHYNAMQYNPDGINITDSVEAVNAVSVSLDMITSLSNVRSPLYMLNFAWVYLVHLIGDLHQPLHAVSRYSEKYPHGDRGGNLVWVRVQTKMLRLHAFWDNICTATPVLYRRPLSSTDLLAISEMADRLLKTYSFSSDLKTMQDVQRMANESYAFAVNSSYADMIPGTTLSAAYISRCVEVAESRLTLGGYRLGYILNKLLLDIDVDENAMKAYSAAVLKRGTTGTHGQQAVKGSCLHAHGCMSDSATESVGDLMI